MLAGLELRLIYTFCIYFFSEAECILFGSSKNGFGFHFSDLDICVTFRGKKPEVLYYLLSPILYLMISTEITPVMS